MHNLYKFVLLTVSFFPCVISAASFDCSKASTQIEVEICNTPTLSQLDEEIAETYFSINKTGRYSELIKRSQINWNKTIREASEQSLSERLEFLFLAKELNNCTAAVSFKDCIERIDAAFQQCQSRGDYTTFAMNVCGGLYIELLELIEPFETSIWREQHADDLVTVKLFDSSYVKWQDYIKSDCEWQYSEYRDGSIRGQVWSSCMIWHYEQRISEINSANSFWETK